MTIRTVISRTRKQEPGSGNGLDFPKNLLPTNRLNGKVSSEIKEYVEKAWETFTSLPMPTISDEAWRRTDLRAMPASDFRLVEEQDTQELPSPPAELRMPVIGSSHAGQVLLTQNRPEVWLDPSLRKQGVIFTDLINAYQEHGDLLTEMIGKLVRMDEGKFAALASAFSNQGVLLYVPKNVAIDQPLHSLLWGPGVNRSYFSHILVWLEDGASVTYMHEAASPNETGGQSLHAGVVEVYVGPGANLRFVELQSWGDQIWNFSHERARVDRDGNLDWICGAVGSHLTKNFSDLDLVGEGASGRLSGFYFTNGKQHLDHDTQQNHLAPHTTSDLLFKGALKNQSRSVWQGMIYVAPGAQKTDGYQANRNLVLSPKARADSIPGLEILADDVRCTHGATVGKIDPDQVFYLRTRGIPYPEAERLIVEGFFDPIMQRIPFEGVRSRFQQAIHEKMTS
jgi:Fe-S cluster assembly protein SufD